MDLSAFNQGRKFFKTKAEAEAERMRQTTLRERAGREAVGLPLNELSAIVEARSVLAKPGKTIKDAATFYPDHYGEHLRRCATSSDPLSPFFNTGTTVWAQPFQDWPSLEFVGDEAILRVGD